MPLLLLLALVLGVAVSLFRRGSLEALGRIRVYRGWLFGAALAALVAGRVVAGLYAGSWIAATVLFALFAAANHRLPGLGLVLVGVALNTAVIVANGGQMPVSLAAADRAGVSEHSITSSPFLSPADSSTVLRPAGDVIPLAVPRFAGVVSPGDVFVASGVALFGGVAPVRARRTLDARRKARAVGRSRAKAARSRTPTADA